MMKIRSLMYVLMGTFTIVACTNSDNEATTGDSPTDKISTGFDWATSRTVSVSITSANKTLFLYILMRNVKFLCWRMLL